MSRNERKRMTVMAGVTVEELTLVQAAELMGVGYRQPGKKQRTRNNEWDILS